MTFDTLFVSDGLGNESSGVSIVVRNLSAAIAKRGTPINVLSIEKETHIIPEIEGVEIRAAQSVEFVRGLKISPNLGRTMKRMLGPRSCVCVHGFWAPTLVSACSIANKLGYPILLSPHGMFSEYSLTERALRKKIALRLGYSNILRSVTAFHATCEAERNEIRAMGLDQPVHIVPNGVDIPTKSEISIGSSLAERRKLVFLSRIHPKKGLRLLIPAWQQLASQRPDWDLVIAGPDELGHELEIRQLISEMNVPRVRIVGPKYGKDKIELLSSADLFVLPSLNENFGLVVPEALAAGTPVVTTVNTPWSMIETVGCGLCSEASISALYAVLNKATAFSRNELNEMGGRARDWII
mgnify:CR=1 FL=1